MPTTKALPCAHLSPVASCAWCHHAADPRYAALFGRTPSALPPAPCLHLGAPTGETVACPSCTGKVQLKTFACAVHGRCTLGKAAPGVACCTTCPDHSARAPAAPPPPPGEPIATRDVLYHLMPRGGEAGQVWRQRLGMLLRRAGLFNGLRIISCMTGDGLEPPSAVRALAEPAGFEVVELQNDPNLREAKTLIELLPRFETSDPSRALLFSHAKGVTRPADLGNTCHPWAVLCHEVCLDYWPLVERVLSTHPIAGPFKKVGWAFSPPVPWHYSCTFFWARSADLFGRRDWRAVRRHRYGAEMMPGVWYRASEAGCLFHEAPAGVMDLYQMSYLHRVLVEWTWFRAANDHLRTREEVPS